MAVKPTEAEDAYVKYLEDKNEGTGIGVVRGPIHSAQVEDDKLADAIEARIGDQTGADYPITVVRRGRAGDEPVAPMMLNDEQISRFGPEGGVVLAPPSETPAQKAALASLRAASKKGEALLADNRLPADHASGVVMSPLVGTVPVGADKGDTLHSDGPGRHVEAPRTPEDKAADKADAAVVKAVEKAQEATAPEPNPGLTKSVDGKAKG